jgi:ABC-type glutathione transport system ATPase component
VTVQAQVLELMRELVTGFGTSMLFITRDIGITAHYCDRVAVIYAGEIVEEAPRDEFFENPHHPYSMLLLSAFAQNERLRRYWLGDRRPGREHAKCRLPLRQPVRAGAGPVPRGRRRSDRDGSRHFIKCHFRWSAEDVTLLSVDDLVQTFPVAGSKALGTRRQWRLLHARARRDAGAGGRIRLRQDDDRPLPA